MAITPIDIQKRQFRTRTFGYEKGEVDLFLELVAEEMEGLFKANQELKEDLARNRAALEQMREREEMLKATLMTAQKVTEELTQNARREAEIVVSEAQLRGERIIRDAEARRVRLIGEIQEVKRQKISFESSLRALVESHLRLLDLDVLALGEEPGGDAEIDDPLALDEGIRELAPEEEILEEEF